MDDAGQKKNVVLKDPGNGVDNYRPISCLPFMWNLSTGGVVSESMHCYDGRRTTNKLKHQQAFNLGSSKSAHLTTRSGLQRIVSRDVYEAKNNTMIS